MIDINNLPISTPLSAGCEPDYENGVANTDIDPDCNFFKTLNLHLPLNTTLKLI